MKFNLKLINVCIPQNLGNDFQAHVDEVTMYKYTMCMQAKRAKQIPAGKIYTYTKNGEND